MNDSKGINKRANDSRSGTRHNTLSPRHSFSQHQETRTHKVHACQTQQPPLTSQCEGPPQSTRYLLLVQLQTRQVTAIVSERPCLGTTRGATAFNKIPHQRTTTKGGANASGDSECQTRSDPSQRHTLAAASQLHTARRHQGSAALKNQGRAVRSHQGSAILRHQGRAAGGNKAKASWRECCPEASALRQLMDRLTAIQTDRRTYRWQIGGLTLTQWL